MSEKTRFARTAKGKKPQYFSDPAIDKLLSMVLTLASELSVTRERLDTVERLIERHGLFDQDQINAIDLTPQARQQRESQRAEFLARLLRTVQMDLEQTVGEDMSNSFEDIIKQVT